MKIVVMSDLHLSSKSWQVRKAFRMSQDADIVLLAGDLVNDGTQAQWNKMYQCICEELPDTPIFAVAGNHDYLVRPIPMIREEFCDYSAIQDWLLKRQSHFYLQDTSGAYAVCIGNVEIIGLNAASHWRRFVFRDGAQLDWLEKHLKESKVKRHIVLCHAPLLAHNPMRNDRKPYLSRDEQLQNIIDSYKNIIFISGHTHISMSSPVGCVEYDEKRNHIYMNVGSIRPTTLLTEQKDYPQESIHGNIVELLIEEEKISVTALSVKNGQPIPRAQYIFNGNYI